jgi:hypothetical protein
VNPITHVICFAVRQTCGVCVKDVAAEVERYYRDHSAALPRAIRQANKRAWQALRVALVGDGFFARAKVWATASGDEKTFREQVHGLIQDSGVSLEQHPAEFRRACLAELDQAIRDGVLETDTVAGADAARGAADLQRFTDPHGLRDGALRAAAAVADALPSRFGSLARLLRQPPPLLVVGFIHYFRREVADDAELRAILDQAANDRLFDDQREAFEQLGEAIDRIGNRFESAIGEAVTALEGQIEATRLAAVAAAASARDTGEKVQRLTAEVFDLRAVLTNLPAGLPDADAIRRLVEEVIRRELKAGMVDGSLRPQDAVSIRGDDERRAIRQLLDRYRQLPDGERQRVPAVLNGLGKLLHGAGDFPEPAGRLRRWPSSPPTQLPVPRRCSTRTARPWRRGSTPRPSRPCGRPSPWMSTGPRSR